MNREIPLAFFNSKKPQIQTALDLQALEEETGELITEKTPEEQQKLEEHVFEERLRIGWEII